MKRWLLQVVLVFLLFLSVSIVPFSTHAQMMGNFPSTNPTVTLSPDDQQEINEGQKLYDQLQNKQTSCNRLTDNDFDKIGEYVMQQQIGDSNRHAQLNQTMKNMMGEQGEMNMHIALGRRATGCGYTGTGGGVGSMMGWSTYGTSGMMGGSWFGWFGVFTTLFWIFGIVDLVLLGLFLIKKIRK